MKWSCPNCTKDFPTEGMLIKHRRYTHGLPELLDIMETINNDKNRMRGRKYLHSEHTHHVQTGTEELLYKMRLNKIYKRTRGKSPIQGN